MFSGRPGQDAITEAHGLYQSGVSTADFGGVHVAISVLLQRAIIASKNKSGKDDAFVAPRPGFQIADVITRVRSIADDQKLVARTHALESFNDQVGIVLGFQPRNIEHVTVWFHPPARTDGSIRRSISAP